MLVVSRSQDTVRWMRDRGIRWIPMFGRQAYKVGDKFRFWGGLVLEAVGGGAGPHRHALRLGREGGHRRALRGQGHAARHRRAGRRHRRRRAISRGDGDHRVQGGGPGRGRLRGQCRDAHAVSRPGLGAGARARNALQHRRRHPHGARHRRAALGALERLPRRAVGPERAVARRPEGRRQLPEALVSPRAHGEPEGRALRRRGRGLPQLHVREVRPHGDRPAAAHRVSDLRPEGRASLARGVPDPRGHQGGGPDDRGPGEEARDRRRGPREDGRGLQRRGHAEGLQSGDQGRQGHEGDHAAQVQLGAAARHAALSRVRGDDGDLVHVRRAAHHGGRPGDRHRAQAHRAGSMPRASWWAGSSITTTRGARA